MSFVYQPLQWPAARPRTDAANRRNGQFSRMVDTQHNWKTRRYLTIADGIARLHLEVERLGGRNGVLTSNLRLTAVTNVPKSDQPVPADPGIAVYFAMMAELNNARAEALRHVE